MGNFSYSLKHINVNLQWFYLFLFLYGETQQGKGVNQPIFPSKRLTTLGKSYSDWIGKKLFNGQYLH